MNRSVQIRTCIKMGLSMFLRSVPTAFMAFVVILVSGTATHILGLFLLPSVSVAYLDGGIFRGWAGLGIPEIALQSLLFAILLPSCFLWFKPDEASRRKLVWPVTALLWGTQTLVQLAVGGTTVALANRVRRKGLFISASLVCAGVVGGASLALAYFVPSPLPTETIVVSTGDGDEIHVDCFIPSGSGPHPAVILFHGVEGGSNAVRRVVHFPNAKAVTDSGYSAFFVRYFEPMSYGDLMIENGNGLDKKAIEEIRLRDYRRWIEIAKEAIVRIRKRPDVDANRVVVVGYSLGAYVASGAVAETSLDGFPAAFVGNFGGIWPETEIHSKFPPTHMYHGELDETVPLSAARSAIQRLRSAGVKAELTIYPGQGHVPTGPDTISLRASTERFISKTLARRRKRGE